MRIKVAWLKSTTFRLICFETQNHWNCDVQKFWIRTGRVCFMIHWFMTSQLCLWISWNCTIFTPKILKNYFGCSSNMARSLEKNHPESGVNSNIVTTPAFPLADLPDLVLLNVADQLSNDDARNLSLTCMRFQVSFT